MPSDPADVALWILQTIFWLAVYVALIAIALYAGWWVLKVLYHAIKRLRSPRGATIAGPIQRQISKPPYIAFLFNVLCFTLTTGSFIYLLASATAQADPNAFSKLGGASLFGVIFTATWANRSWREIKELEPDTEASFRRKHRSVEVKVITAVLICLVAAGIVGANTGNRIGRQSRLKALSDEVYALGLKSGPIKQRFIEARTRATPTFDAYVQRCTDLESALNEYEPALQQMHSLLGRVQQLADDQRMLSAVTTMKAVFERDLEFARLVRREIEYAKRIPGLSPSGQVQFYKLQIQPIRDNQAKVAEDEVELVKSVKRNGVQLPEQMYEELGIK